MVSARSTLFAALCTLLLVEIKGQLTLDSLAGCIERLIKARPDLTSKLNEEQLGHLCRNLYNWPHDTPNGMLSADSGSVNQRKWKKVVECRGAACLASIIARKCPGGVCPEDDPFIARRRQVLPPSDMDQDAVNTKAPWVAKDFTENTKGPVDINWLKNRMGKSDKE